MAPTLYMNEASPPVRSVLLLCKAVDIELDLQQIDVTNGEQLTPHFRKINPQHTLPTLDDDGFIIWDSHAINTYLINKYSPNHSLYPTNPRRRAVIDQRLHFDSGAFFPKLEAIVKPITGGASKIIPSDKAHALSGAYSILEDLLERSKYVAGDNLSIADFSIITTLTSANVLVPVAENRFPKISEWLTRMKSLPYYQEGNQVGLETYTNFIKSKLA